MRLRRRAQAGRSANAQLCAAVLDVMDGTVGSLGHRGVYDASRCAPTTRRRCGSAGGARLVHPASAAAGRRPARSSVGQLACRISVLRHCRAARRPSARQRIRRSLPSAAARVLPSGARPIRKVPRSGRGDLAGRGPADRAGIPAADRERLPHACGFAGGCGGTVAAHHRDRTGLRAAD